MARVRIIVHTEFNGNLEVEEETRTVDFGGTTDIPDMLQLLHTAVHKVHAAYDSKGITS